MTDGQGGFNYDIEVRDKFTKPLEEFKAKLAEAQQAFQEFRQRSLGMSEASKKQTSALKDANKEVREATRTSEAAAKAEEKYEQATGVRARAIKNLKAALRDQKVAEEELKIINEKGLTLLSRQEGAARRAAKGFDAQAEALKRIAKAQREVDTRAAVSKINPLLDPRTGGKIVAPPTLGDAGVEEKARRLLALEKERLLVRQRVESLRPPVQGPPSPFTGEQFGPGKELADETALQIGKIKQASEQRLKVEKELRAIGLDTRGNKILSEKERIEARVNAILERQRILQGANALLSSQGLTPQGTKLPQALTPKQIAQQRVTESLQRLEVEKFTRELERSNPKIRELNRELGKTQSVGNRISFTFRRLIGIFAAFTAVRLFIGQLRQAIAESVRFNATLEDTALGISSLILATGKLTTLTGQATSPAEGFALAQKEAAKQVALLRRENLRTAATFPELAKAFESGVAPGLTNGLNLDQVRQVTVLLSKAASSLALPQNQLPEEIRSLLQGTITPRNTRIATSLGITNEDIRNAKEMGNLFEFLQKKLEAFNIAGDEGLKTFSVRLSNAKDAMAGLLAEGFNKFFVKLSDLLDFISNKLVDISSETFINDEAVKAVSVLGEVLSLAVDEAKRLLTTLSAGSIERIFETIATTLKAIVSLTSIFVEGLLKASYVLSFITSTISKVANTLSSIFSPQIRFILTNLLALVLAAKSLQLIFLDLPRYLFSMGQKLVSLVTLTNQMKGHLAGAVLYLETFNGGLKAALITLGAITAAIAVGAFVYSDMKEDIEKAAGVQLTFWQALRVFASLIGDLVVAQWKNITDVIISQYNLLLAATAKFFSFVLTQMGRLADLVPNLFLSWVPGLELALNVIKSKVKSAVEELDTFAARRIGQASGLPDRVKDRFVGAYGNTIPNAKRIADEAARVPLFDQIEKLPGIVGNTTKEMENLVTSHKQFKDDIDEAREALVGTATSLKAQGAVVQQTKVLSEALAKIDKEDSQLKSQIVQAQRDLNTAKGESFELDKKLNNLGHDDLRRTQRAMSLTKTVLDLKHQIAGEETKAALARIAIGKADERGDAAAKREAEFQLFSATDTIEQLKMHLEDVKVQTEKLFEGTTAAQQKATSDLALGIVESQARELDGARRVREARAEEASLRKAALEAASLKIAEIGIKEYEDSRKRIKELNQRIAATDLLNRARRSGLSDEEQRQAGTNDIQAEKDKLDLIREQNRSNEEASKKLIDRLKKEGAPLQLIVALQSAFNQLVTEGALLERQQEQAIEGSVTAQDLLLRKQREAHEDLILSMSQERRELSLQIKGQEDLLRARGTIGDFDDRLAQAKAEIKAQEARMAAVEETAKVEEKRRKEVNALIVDEDLRKKKNQELNAFLIQQAYKYAGMVAALALMRAELSEMLRIEKELSANHEADSRAQAIESRLETQRRRLDFDAQQGSGPRSAQELANLTSTVLIESTRLQNAKRLAELSELNLQREVDSAGEADVRNQKAAELEALQQANSAQLEDQVESLREAVVLLERFKARLSAPVREGLIEGMRQFIREAPDNFELSLDVMKQGLQGLTQVGADSLTAIFDPRNTTTFEERLGELALSIGNTIFKGLLDQLLAGLLSSVFSSALQGTGLTTAAVALEGAAVPWTGVVTGLHSAAAALGTAAGVQAAITPLSISGLPAGSTGGLLTRGGFRYFAKGGARGTPKRDARDKIPAMLAEGEYVMRPEAVSALGVGFLEDLNSLRMPRALEGIAALGVGARSRGAASPVARPTSPQTRTPQREAPLRILPVLTTDAQTMERLLAGGGGSALNVWLASQGYAPRFN